MIFLFLTAPFCINILHQADIADWARAGVAQCSGMGLLNGSDVGFQPDQTTTRAMGAVILHRLCQYDFPA